MTAINLRKELQDSVESAIKKVTEALKKEGFGVLTRIDLHTKIREKLGKEIPAAVILGACNPLLAYEAYSANPDVASLLPCNAVIRELSSGKISVELAKPSSLMQMLGDKNLIELARAADEKLERVLESL